MNLPQVSTDLRALGQLLITQADEVDALLNGINLSALAALFGPVNGGGGPVEGRPFAQPQSKTKPPKPVHVKPAKVQLTPEQQAQVRDHYNRLPAKDQTLKSRHQLAAAYGITNMQLASIIFRSYDKARVARLAKQAESKTQEALSNA
jgi:hypothetical protein